MEITEPRPPAQPTSVRRCALVLCLTVVPVAFSAAGLTLTFPVAEIAYEIEAATPNSDQRATESAAQRERHRGDDVVATLLAEGLTERLTAEAAVATDKLAAPAAEVPSGGVERGSVGGAGAPQAEPAVAAAQAPDEVTRERQRVQERERERVAERERATERERAESATSAGVASAPTETARDREPQPNPTAPAERETQRDRETEREAQRGREPRGAVTPAPPKLRQPGCSHPPALRAHSPWSAAERCGALFPLPYSPIQSSEPVSSGSSWPWTSVSASLAPHLFSRLSSQSHMKMSPSRISPFRGRPNSEFCPRVTGPAASPH